MPSTYPPPENDNRLPSAHLRDDDGFDTDLDHDLIRLLEENARLRALVTELSCLVLKHVVDRNR